MWHRQQEEVKQSTAILADGVYEMMNLQAYMHFSAKPKNGGLDPEEARARWEAEFLKEDAVTDLLGPNARLARRVAIRVKDLIILRDTNERSRTAHTHTKGARTTGQPPAGVRGRVL